MRLLRRLRAYARILPRARPDAAATEAVRDLAPRPALLAATSGYEMAAPVGNRLDPRFSIVGIDAIQYRYYRRKLECEQIIERSNIPHTILRATQFHELIDWILTTLGRWPLVPLPLDGRGSLWVPPTSRTAAPSCSKGSRSAARRTTAAPRS
jgi:hypothetical protein